MYNIKLGDNGNRLDVSYKDHFDLRQGEQFYKELQETAPKLKKGFMVLADMSSLERMDLSAKLYVEKAMDLLNKKGVSKVVRIIPDDTKDIGFKILSIFHYSSKVVIHTYKSYQEAEEHLK
ncbi:MAG: hypothetical protein V1883_00555 [Candidatus Omnitrophota bacterium]